MNNSQLEEVLKTSDEGIKSILTTILNMNMWNKDNERNIINGINKLLSTAKNRQQGLELLNLIINNCSSTVICENGMTWISHCLIKYPLDNLKELKFTNIGNIVNSCCREQEFNKRFVSEYISKVFETCLSTHTNYHETVAALETLIICMKHYGSWFAPHRLRLENCICNYFECSSKEVIESAALAFHYTQQVGSAGIDGISHKINFSTSFDKLCATAQKLFDSFFENETEIDQSDRSDQETFEFPDLPLYMQKMVHITARRIRNILKFITTMLLKGFPVEKEIKPGDVLDLISRGSTIHRCLNSENNSLEDYQFSILLNQIQIELLHLLHGLIICCYQEIVYKVLGSWLRVAKGAVHTHFQTQFVKSILKDVKPLKNDVTLNMQSDILRNKSKKAIQKAVQEKIISSGHRSKSTEKLTSTEELNREMNCLFALDTLKDLLVCTILKLQPNIWQELYTYVISTLIDIQTSNIRHPYTNPDCEAKLYEVLVAFYEQDTLKILPPLQLSIQILSRGVNNNNRKIALTCENGLNVLEKLCQPVCPSLFVSENTCAKKVVGKSSLFIDEKVVKHITEQKENATEKTVQSSDDQKPNEMETEAHETAVNEAPEESVVNGEITDPKSTVLKPEASIHIIDMRIIKTSPSIVNIESNQVVNHNVEPTINNQQHNLPEDARTQVTELHLKSEILSTNMETQQKEINIETIANEEPPPKKIRIEEASSITEKVKQEELHLKLEDDIFEEGDEFVDVVKEY